MPGVVRTRVGYAGGISDNPTYHNLGQHSETIQIEFDPEVISYEELFDIFWDNHNPYSQSRSRQYRNILFYHNEDQRQVAEAKAEQAADQSGREVKTDIVEFEEFHLAEDYHQKYYLQSKNMFQDHYRDIYELSQFIDSTAVARVNGYLGRFGSEEQLLEEMGKLGLDQETARYLLEYYNVPEADWPDNF